MMKQKPQSKNDRTRTLLRRITTQASSKYGIGGRVRREADKPKPVTLATVRALKEPDA
jgi:hypothetical protein